MKLDYKMSDFKRIDYRKLHIEEQELAYHKRQEEITEAQDELRHVRRQCEACRELMEIIHKIFSARERQLTRKQMLLEQVLAYCEEQDGEE